MDPITMAVTTALANLGQNVIMDAYGALKAALQQKYGVESELAQAVDKLEEKPESKPRQAVLQEEVASSGADQDPELLQVAKSLMAQLKELPGSKDNIKQDVDIRGDRNIVQGKGDITVHE